MKLVAREVIANVKAREPAQSKDGPVVGPAAAADIGDALDAAGFRLIHIDHLKELRAGAETLLRLLGEK